MEIDQIIPGTGWRALYTDEEGKTLSRPVVVFALLDDGITITAYDSDDRDGIRPCNQRPNFVGIRPNKTADSFPPRKPNFNRPPRSNHDNGYRGPNRNY